MCVLYYPWNILIANHDICSSANNIHCQVAFAGLQRAERTTWHLCHYSKWSHQLPFQNLLATDRNFYLLSCHWTRPILSKPPWIPYNSWTNDCRSISCILSYWLALLSSFSALECSSDSTSNTNSHAAISLLHCAIDFLSLVWTNNCCCTCNVSPLCSQGSCLRISLCWLFCKLSIKHCHSSNKHLLASHCLPACVHSNSNIYPMSLYLYRLYTDTVYAILFLRSSLHHHRLNSGCYSCPNPGRRPPHCNFGPCGKVLRLEMSLNCILRSSPDCSV